MTARGIRGIPTTYSGVRFRSRLEARWAAFFDYVGWRWDYEPLDLNGWIPDFVLHGHEGKTVMVEIKPTYVFPEDIAKKVVEASRPWRPRSEILLLGARLFLHPGDDNTHPGASTIGWLAEMYESPNGEQSEWFMPAQLVHKDNLFDFAHDAGDYAGRMFGIYDSDYWFVYEGDRAATSVVSRYWNLAGNKVQWRPAA